MLVALVALAGVTAAATAAWAGDKPRVAFLGTELDGGDASDTQLFDDAAIKGLQRTDITFVPIDSGRVPRTKEGLICAGPGCLAQAALITGAGYFVRAEAHQQGTPGAAASYVGKVQVFRAEPFATAASTDFFCEACSAETLAQKFEQRATDAMVKALAATLGGSTEPRLAATESSNDKPTRVGPWIVGVAGGALIGAGIFLIARGDQSTCPGKPASECPRTYSDARTGWLLGGVGLAAIASAAVWGWLTPRDHGPAPDERAPIVAIGPGGIVVGGRF